MVMETSKISLSRVMDASRAALRPCSQLNPGHRLHLQMAASLDCACRGQNRAGGYDQVYHYCPIPTRKHYRKLRRNTTHKVLSNVPQDIRCSAPRRRKIHDNSMYYFACRCTNEIIHANSMYFFEIASKTMHTEELAAAKPPPTLLFASTLMRFRKKTGY